jgi:hypothetical protein
MGVMDVIALHLSRDQASDWPMLPRYLSQLRLFS